MEPTTPSPAHPETMDMLSRAWCSFAVQTLSPELHPEKSLALLDTPIKDRSDPFPIQRVQKTVKMEAEDHVKSIPPWKSNDMKSFIWMQQAMHPELNYSSNFRKKWFQWKIVPFKNLSIKKWLSNIRQSRKDENRLQRAEIHAAISVAGVAAALAAIAADTSRSKDDNSGCGREAAVASAAALVAAQCEQVAQAMGAKREQLSSVIGSALSSTTARDILTLTAAAATSLKGAATLKARSDYKNKSTGGVASVLPIEDNHEIEIDFNLEKSRSMLAKGVLLKVESPNGTYKKRSISIVQHNDTKVILKIRKLNMLKTKQEGVVLDMFVELYRDEDAGAIDDVDEEIHTCYLIVLMTNKGTFKLDMANDYHKYKIWATTIIKCSCFLLILLHEYEPSCPDVMVLLHASYCVS